MILSFAKTIPIIGAMVSAGKSAKAIAAKIRLLKDEDKIVPKEKPKPDIKPKPKPEKDLAQGGIVKRYKGGLMVKPKAAKRGY